MIVSEFQVLHSIEDTPKNLVQKSIHSYALSIVAGAVILAILYLGKPVFITAICATIVALILEPFVGLLVRLRIPRGIATLVISALGILAMYFLAVASFTQISSLAEDFPQFKERLSVVVDSVRDRIQKTEDSTSQLFAGKKETPPLPVAPRKTRGKQTGAPAAVDPNAIQEVRIHQESNRVSDFVVSSLGSVYQFVLMASFVPFLVYFMLSWRDHIYRSFLRFFQGADRIAATRSLDSISGVARAFVVGNFLIGVLTALFSAIAFQIMHIPYPFLAGGLSGFLSIVPYVGVPLASLPPMMTAIAGGQGTSSLLLIILVVVSLHLFSLNVLYPKLVGARVHLNPLVVTFSLMFWGYLWDAAGLILAIPLTAGLKAICDNVVALRPIGRFLGD